MRVAHCVVAAAASLGLVACDRDLQDPATVPALSATSSPGQGIFSNFEPLAAQAACVEPPATPAGFAGYQPFVLPAGYQQTIVASERGDFLPVAGTGANLPDMMTLNETGPQAGRYLYRTHEVGSNGALTVTDLVDGGTVLADQADHYERLDGIVWSPWRTVLFAEETKDALLPDPDAPDALRGMVYEYDPGTGVSTVLPAVGSRSHEGLRFDAQGNLYGISESSPGEILEGIELSGGIFKFVPDRPGDLSSGQLYALKVLDASRTGEAEWVPLDRDLVRTDSDAAAVAAEATAWARPEDVEIASSTGNTRGGQQVMFVAVTGENLVLRIELDGDRAFVSNYVQGVAGFDTPDNLALDPHGNLYIAEDNGPGDLWVAHAGGGSTDVAGEVVRFASLADCAAEPTGIYFDRGGKTLFVHVQHAGGALGNDLAVAISRSGPTP